MGLRFRRRFNIASGVSLNIGRTGSSVGDGPLLLRAIVLTVVLFMTAATQALAAEDSEPEISKFFRAYREVERAQQLSDERIKQKYPPGTVVWPQTIPPTVFKGTTPGKK